MRKTLLISTLFLIFCFSFGCSSQKQPPHAAPLPELSISIACFNQPRVMDDLLAGIMVSDQPFVGDKVLMNLDSSLQQVLAESSDRKFINVAGSYSCQVKATKVEKKDKTALDYWIQVGVCLDADMILVPQVTEWRERVGSAMGAESPAAVTMNFYLIDVKGEQLVSRYHFEEVQQSLTDNLLSFNKFVDRGGRWVTAEELAHEGMRQAIKEMGL